MSPLGGTKSEDAGASASASLFAAPETPPGGPLPRLVEGIDRAVVWASIGIGIAIMTVLFLAILTNVVLRYLTASGITWAYELPQLLFPWLVVCGAALAAQRGTHIAVEPLVASLPDLPRRLALGLVHLLTLGLFAALAYYAASMAQTVAGSHLAVTGLSEAWGFSSLIFGSAAIALTAATRVYRLAFPTADRRGAP